MFSSATTYPFSRASQGSCSALLRAGRANRCATSIDFARPPATDYLFRAITAKVENPVCPLVRFVIRLSRSPHPECISIFARRWPATSIAARLTSSPQKWRRSSVVLVTIVPRPISGPSAVCPILPIGAPREAPPRRESAKRFTTASLFDSAVISARPAPAPLPRPSARLQRRRWPRLGARRAPPSSR